MEAHSADRATRLIDLMVARQRAIAAAPAELAALEVEFVDLRRAQDEHAVGLDRHASISARYAADEIGLALRRSTTLIQREVARTRRVRARLPQVWQLWAIGQIDDYKVLIIDQAATRLIHTASWARLDETLAPLAAAKTVAQLRTWLNRFVARTEPGEFDRRHQRTHADRDVRIDQGPDGTGWVTGDGKSTDAADVNLWLNKLARELGAADPRTMGQRRSDIFFDLLLGRRPNGATGGKAPGTTVIAVTVPIQSLVGDSSAPGELLDRSAPLPADLIRDRAIQPGTLFYRLLTDHAGNLLNVTQMGRFPTHQLGFAVQARDGTCVMPTCNSPAIQCDLDHTNPHPQGPTAATNLGPIDRRHHNGKTAGILQVRQPRPGEFEWTTPTGHRYTKKAEPFDTADWLSYQDHAALHPDDYLTTDNFAPDDPILDDLLRAADVTATEPVDPAGVTPPDA